MGKFAVDLAIQKAKEAGIGMVTVRGLSFFSLFSHIFHNLIPFSTVFRKDYFDSHRLRVQPLRDCWLVCAQSYGAWINRKSSFVS